MGRSSVWLVDKKRFTRRGCGGVVGVVGGRDEGDVVAAAAAESSTLGGGGTLTPTRTSTRGIGSTPAPPPGDPRREEDL